MLISKKQSGFTIVELLIVIVVIGVLAALVLNSFSGAQLRARNAQTTDAVEAYKKGLIAYSLANNSYPPAPAGVYVCLGENYPSGRCWDGVNYTPYATFNTPLKTTMGSTLPTPSVAARPIFGILFAPSSLGWQVDGRPADFIIYALEGNATRCSAGPAATYLGGANFSSTPPASGRSSTDAGGNATCWVPLPNPS